MASKGDETAKENEENEDKVLLLQSTITDKDNEIQGLKEQIDSKELEIKQLRDQK